MVTFTNQNQNFNVNKRMLPLWTNSYTKFVIKILNDIMSVFLLLS